MRTTASYRHTLARYTTGFILSLILTGLAFAAVHFTWVSGWSIILFLALLAVLQLFVQLIFFLHLAEEKKPRWNLTSLLFAGMVIVIIVFGSLWIMKNLNYDHGNGQHGGMPANMSDHEIIHDEGYSQ